MCECPRHATARGLLEPAQIYTLQHGTDEYGYEQRNTLELREEIEAKVNIKVEDILEGKSKHRQRKTITLMICPDECVNIGDIVSYDDMHYKLHSRKPVKYAGESFYIKMMGSQWQ